MARTSALAGDFARDGFVVVPAVFDPEAMSQVQTTIDVACDQFRLRVEPERSIGIALSSYIHKLPDRSPGVSPRGLEDEPYILGILARLAGIKAFLEREELWRVAAALLTWTYLESCTTTRR
jgi:hypothetical protein